MSSRFALLAMTGLDSRQILLVDAGHVVLDVSHQHVDQRPRADGRSAGGAEAGHGFIAQVGNHQNVRAAQGIKFLQQLSQRDSVIACRADVPETRPPPEQP